MHVPGQLLQKCARASRNIENPFVRLYMRQIDGASERLAFEGY